MVEGREKCQQSPLLCRGSKVDVELQAEGRGDAVESRQGGTHPASLKPGDRCLACAHPSCQVALAQTSRFPGCSDAFAHVRCESRLPIRLVVLCPLSLIHGLAAPRAHLCPCRPRQRSSACPSCA